MVTPLWKACVDGDVQKVHELLNDPSSVDLEVKDQNGYTPLIQAIRHGHTGIAVILLGKGANPLNASNHGRPEDFTSDPGVHELLSSAKEKFMASGLPSTGIQQTDNYSQEANGGIPKPYYGQPQAPYMYYSAVPSVGMIPEGVVPYYPPPPPSQSNAPPSANHSQPDTPGLSNLPPPEIARLIPCRYFPACRYGASCMFAHPGAPYFPGQMPPPAQYSGPFDPMTPQPYPTSYYAVPSGPFAHPNGVNPMASPMSPTSIIQHTPTPPLNQGRPLNEMMSPVQAPFNPQPAPPSAYGVASPMSPSYPHPTAIPVPVGITQLPPPHPQLGHPNHPSSVMYPANAPVMPVPGPGMGHRREASVPFAAGMHSSMENGVGMQSPSVRPQPDGFGPHGPPMQREHHMGHARRGSARRGSSAGNSRKPPCFFFPAGRCRNGDECRFPHVMPEGPMHGSGNKFGPRARNNSHMGNGPSLDEKMASLSLQEEKKPSPNPPNADNRPTDANAGTRPPLTNGNGKQNHVPNGNNNNSGARNNDRRNIPKQRIPNAEDFPVLAGSTTPPSRSPGPHARMLGGPTAAQVLQAPPPTKKEQAKDASVNGHAVNGDAGEHSPISEGAVEEKPATVTPIGNGVHETLAPKPLHPSFASVASAAPDVSNQVSVSA